MHIHRKLGTFKLSNYSHESDNDNYHESDNYNYKEQLYHASTRTQPLQNLPFKWRFVMSVQKLVVTQDETGFTMLKNNILQNFTDAQALGVWVYLASLPPNWTFYKEQLQSHFNIGRERINRILNTLKSHGLITINNQRDSKGRFIQMNLHVCSMHNFKVDAQPREPAPVLDLNDSVHPSTGKPSTGNQSLDTDSYKDISKKKENKKEISLIDSATDVAHDNPENCFEEFWDLYPIKKNKFRAKNIWDKKKLNLKAKTICHDVFTRINIEHQWKEKQFIPHPSTYLRDELWNDDISQETICKQKPADAFNTFIQKQKNKGDTYDQHGNVYDPFR